VFLLSRSLGAYIASIVQGGGLEGASDAILVAARDAIVG